MLFKEIISYLQEYKGNLKIMEVCGTHTSAIFKNGIRTLLPAGIKLVSGPGCPVCVTPASVIDDLVDYSWESCVLSFGDMFRVPGNLLSLAEVKAQGGNVELMYSPFEVLDLAKKDLEHQFVIAAVGFETTIPIYAALLDRVIQEKITNVKLYTAFKTMPEALDFICANEAVDAFLCPGHVSAVIGSRAYEPLWDKYQKPFVIAGFEAEHILSAVYEIAVQKEKSKPSVKNLYPSVVHPEGQKKALELMDKYFAKADSFWRGIGNIKGSGYEIREEYQKYSANPIQEADKSAFGSERISLPLGGTEAAFPPETLPQGCRCADVMLGRISPNGCPLFDTACAPQHPVGPCMVSSEGTCGIWKNEG